MRLGAAVAKSGFAFVSVFEAEGTHYGLTVDMAVLPLERLSIVKPSRFHGIVLEEPTPLPVVFARGRSIGVYVGDPKAQGLRFERRLDFREAVAVTGKRVQIGKVAYLEARDGRWIADGNLTRIDSLPEPPAWAQPGRKWVDVSLLQQILVAYEGTRPVFATLVSTGADGTGDPATTRSTVQGQFPIHTKHVTVTMASDAGDDEFDLREEPYVQYFKDGYALHAAYWHDGFGVPRSHGCVNLSPRDARWLFAWTTPSVPAAWHGAMSPRGTLVSIRP
jgi:hypothetical protein